MSQTSQSIELADAVLGVRQSVSGRAWIARSASKRMGAMIAERHSLPLVVGEMLAGRGVDPDEVESFLNPSLRDSLPDPSTITDMDKAVARLATAIQAGERIAVFGDYDVDGATSSALLHRYMAAIGVPLRIYIPDRMSEGYGPNAAAMETLRCEGIDLVVTVDCGTLSYEPLAHAKRLGLEVIVVDHHKAEPTLPEAVAVVNPNRLDDDSGLGQLAAVGVTFMLVVALNRALRAGGYFANGGREPDLMALLDIVALGTVCDVVPLTGVNRALVAQGLKVMAQRRTVGLAALADVGRVSEAPGTYHAGFILGPRVNAGGRVGQSSLGARLLTTDDPVEARRIAEELDRYNEERRAIEAEVLEAAIDQVESLLGAGGTPDGLVFAAGEGWHAGVIGIVASRLKDRYGVPALVFAVEEGEAKGSGRSIPGVDLGAAVIEAAQAGIILKGGGHAMAAGLSVAPPRLDELQGFLKHLLRPHVTAAEAAKALKIDGVVALSGATPELIERIEAVGPFGTGNPAPRFAIGPVALVKVDRVGETHVRAIFKGRDGGSIKAMAFRVADEPMGQLLLAGVGRDFHIAGKLKIDTWSGTPKAEIMLDDVAEAGASHAAH
ncbi:single-stranded-DNA-specific exonuclease RecJ [Pseudokordiimonas caeni]|uniref:single-stranded-DNA-specific exonuclease RecJ n=1 Tax=Pseudokordiimonas caeni TaxID=2997908 RepID=UPI002810FDD8|nr:single-stranded-DNA-specific exonuclease RecJ [Pseudokordiimonas caeni]